MNRAKKKIKFIKLLRMYLRNRNYNFLFKNIRKPEKMGLIRLFQSRLNRSNPCILNKNQFTINVADFIFF